jgi:serine phosphatase RsbU (regulator of sigma subunit)
MIQGGFAGEVPKRARAGMSTDVSSWYSPAGNARAGGDWCDAVALSADAVALTIGDVAGHGESVAATAASMRAAIVTALLANHDPASILGIANDLAYTHEEMIVTAIVGILDRRRGTLTFANAGHPPPVMAFAAGHAVLAKSPADLPLGIFATHQAADYVIALPRHALIALYTDGVTEHDRDPIAGEADLARACQRVYDDDGANAAQRIAQLTLLDTRGTDDAAVLAVRIHS